MAITRRQFLKRGSCAAAAGGLFGSGLFANPFIRRAFADTIGDRYFIVLFLDGGNDGLNTVIPVDNGSGNLRDAYEFARGSGVGGLRMTPAELAGTLVGTDASTGAQLAIHPGLGDLKTMYDAGQVAVIQNCGYPNYSLSHEESRYIWQTATPNGSASTGWLGRYLAANYTGVDIPGVSIADDVGAELQQGITSVLAIRRLRDFRFPYDNQFGGDTALKRDAFLALYDEASNEVQSILKYVGDGGKATLLSSETYPQLHDLYIADRASFDMAYESLGNSTARDFREVAKVIYGMEQATPNIGARFFQLENGGYDTHSDQGGAETDGQHYGLLHEIGASIKLFYDDLADMGAADKVCVMVWSEFSRRIPQNDNGTDHGSQGPVFVIGGGVTGGVYGRHANIDDAALDGEGNTVYSQNAADSFRTTDIRDVYGTILKHWLNMPHPQILSTVLPLDGGNPDTRWTTENFDMGFLP